MTVDHNRVKVWDAGEIFYHREDDLPAMVRSDGSMIWLWKNMPYQRGEAHCAILPYSISAGGDTIFKILHKTMRRDAHDTASTAYSQVSYHAPLWTYDAYSDEQRG